MAQNALPHFRRHAQLEKIRCQCTTKSMPTLPRLAQLGPNLSSTQVVQVQGEAHLVSGKDVAVAQEARPVGNKDFLKKGNYRHSCSAAFGFCLSDMRAPDRPLDVQRFS